MMRGLSLIIIAVPLLLVFIFSSNAGAQTEVNIDSEDVVTTDTVNPGVIGASSKSYVAQAGDSVTLLARATISQFIDVNNISLTPEMSVYSETVLTQQTGTSPLSIGEVVNFDMRLVDQIVNDSTKLPPSQLAAWSPWASLAGLT